MNKYTDTGIFNVYTDTCHNKKMYHPQSNNLKWELKTCMYMYMY